MDYLPLISPSSASPSLGTTPPNQQCDPTASSGFPGSWCVCAHGVWNSKGFWPSPSLCVSVSQLTPPPPLPETTIHMCCEGTGSCSPSLCAGVFLGRCGQCDWEGELWAVPQCKVVWGLRETCPWCRADCGTAREATRCGTERAWDEEQSSRGHFPHKYFTLLFQFLWKVYILMPIQHLFLL